MTVRPRRSVLYMPASNPRALEKARELAADGLILDLEDAVAPEAKPQAREAVVKALQRGFGDREVLVRINGLDTRWWVEDIAAAASARPDAVLVPKVSSPRSMSATLPPPRSIPRPGSPALSWAPMTSPKILAPGSFPAARRCCRG